MGDANIDSKQTLVRTWLAANGRFFEILAHSAAVLALFLSLLIFSRDTQTRERNEIGLATAQAESRVIQTRSAELYATVDVREERAFAMAATADVREEQALAMAATADVREEQAFAMAATADVREEQTLAMAATADVREEQAFEIAATADARIQASLKPSLEVLHFVSDSPNFLAPTDQARLNILNITIRLIPTRYLASLLETENREDNTQYLHILFENRGEGRIEELRIKNFQWFSRDDTPSPLEQDLELSLGSLGPNTAYALAVDSAVGMNQIVPLLDSSAEGMCVEVEILPPAKTARQHPVYCGFAYSNPEDIISMGFDFGEISALQLNPLPIRTSLMISPISPPFFIPPPFLPPPPPPFLPPP